MARSALNMDQAPDAVQSPKRLAIVDAATKLFLSQGFGAVSVDAIAAKAQVSKPTVYSHFENKEALFSGVMGGVCERAGGRDACPLANEEAALYMPMNELLQKTGEHVLGVITSPEAIEIFRVVIGEAERFPQLGRNFYEFGPATTIEMIGGYISVKSRSGELKVGDPEKAAHHLLAMMIFPVQMELACGVREQVSKDEISEIVADALITFMKIYTPH